MYIIVVGQDEVALRIAEGLMTKHDVVFIGPSTAETARLDRLDVHVIDGSPTSTAVLKSARITQAD